jgi:hypothetical protein
MNRTASARVVGLTLALMAIGTGTASAAAPPAANARFLAGGVQVYEDGAVGSGCRTFGFCEGVAEDLDRTATPRYLSTRKGEAVLVTCRSAGLAGVVGFFEGGEAPTPGWVRGDMVEDVRQDGRMPACGAL